MKLPALVAGSTTLQLSGSLGCGKDATTNVAPRLSTARARCRASDSNSLAVSDLGRWQQNIWRVTRGTGGSKKNWGVEHFQVNKHTIRCNYSSFFEIFCYPQRHDDLKRNSVFTVGKWKLWKVYSLYTVCPKCQVQESKSGKYWLTHLLCSLPDGQPSIEIL